MKLSPKHLEELHLSGLNDETIELAGVYSASAAEVEKILGYNYECGALVYPYRNLGEMGEIGEILRIKLDIKINGTQYRTKAGGENHLYLTHLTPEQLSNSIQPLNFTEGEKKALKATQDFMPTVGLSGVWSWKTKDEEENSIPVREFDLINFTNRTINIFFDSDIAHNYQIRVAEMEFAHECKERGASLIKAYRLPPSKDGSKVGIDDFLMNHLPEKLTNLPVVDPIACYNIRSAKKIKDSNAKKEQIVDAIIKGLINWGYFICSQNGELFYFDQVCHKLFFIMSEEYKSLLSFRYQINPQEQSFKFLIERIKSIAFECGQKVHIYRFAHYDEKGNRLYIYANNHKMYRIDGTIQLLNNGDDGVLFCHDPLLEPIECIITDKYEDLCTKYIFKYANLDESSVSKEDQIFIAKMWLFALFFPELLPTRVILLCCGPKGSSKTTLLQLIGRLLFGKHFNVTSICNNKEDAFIASICANYFIAYDNVDGKIQWLQDNLARIATGQDVRRRDLFTTNREIIFRPNVNIALTSRTPKFKRDDVVDRLLVLRTVPINSNQPYKFLINQVLEHRQEIWANILYQLNFFVKQLPKVSAPEHVDHRMADFAAFCLRIAEISACREQCRQALEKMRTVNTEFMFDGDPLVDSLFEWIKKHGDREVSAAELLSELRISAGTASGLNYPSAVSFGKRLDNIKTDLEDELNIRIHTRKLHGKTLYRFERNESLETKKDSSDSFPF